VKIGAENKKSVIAMVVLLAIAIPLIFYETKGVFWGTNASAAPSISAPAPPPRPGGLLAQDGSDPRLRTDILEASRKVRYEAGGRNIFTMEAEIPKIEVPPRPQRTPGPPAPTPTPPPPPPPPIPIKYYGFASKPSEPKRVFLQQQGVEQIWVAAQGDVVARRYRVVQIAPNTVTMEDVLTGNRQQIPITAR
jgi:hypothetical protein